MRYASLSALRAFVTRRASAPPEDYDTALKVLVGLMDAVAERLADVLELAGADLDRLSRAVFSSPRPLAAAPAAPAPGGVRAKRVSARQERRNFTELLQRLGRCSDLASRVRETAVSFNRLVAFLRGESQEWAQGDLRSHLKVVGTDLSALGDYAGFLSTKVSFLLDATLGLINNEQNLIIKILSVTAVVFGPPTLVASIYGMNFEHIPELKWAYGYPFALALMILSAVLPYWLFKRKGWL